MGTAKYRLKEAQARKREKEQKDRTYRLIKEGAALEKVYPKVREVDLEDLESYMQNLFESNNRKKHILNQNSIATITKREL